jgi:uncharacterized protein (UPF0332 family)
VLCLAFLYNPAMVEAGSIYRTKAAESLQGAESEFGHGRYNNCANRCYYACFHAAVHALEEAGFRPSGARATWSHDSLQGTFARELITRRKTYPGELRDVLTRIYKLRQNADYTRDMVSETQASRALRRTRTFVQAVQSRGGASQ